MSTTNVKCDYCGKIYPKENKEINRCKKRGIGNYCGNSCVAKYRNGEMTPEYWKKQYQKYPTLRGYENNRLNDLSPFTQFLNKSRASIKKHQSSIDVDAAYLKSVWDKQQGICPYTGIKMLLPESAAKRHSIKSLKKASLDRIDSSLGYIKNNVEFVCFAVNLAKNNHSKKDMLDFIEEVKLSRNTLSVKQSQPT